MKIFCVGFLSVALLISTALAQPDFSKIEIKATHIAKNVYLLESTGTAPGVFIGNVAASVGEDGILIVDDQFAPLAGKIVAALAQLNPGKLRFVLNTHHHGDHTGGNATFGAQEATIIAQSHVRERLAANAKAARTGLPVITFDHAASVHFNGEEITLLHHGPGHTDGDSIIHFTGSNVVHLGDQYVNASFPFIDFSSGGDLDGFVRTIAAVLEKIPADARIIPGHGPLATVADLRNYHTMLTETIAWVRQRMAEGKTLEELRAAGLPEQWRSYGGGWITPRRWIETIYNQAQKTPAGK